MSNSDKPSTSSAINNSQLDGFINELNSVGYATIPLLYCPHLSMVNQLPDNKINISDSCLICNDLSENWLCLICYKVFCSRYINKHGAEHFEVYSILFKFFMF